MKKSPVGVVSCGDLAERYMCRWCAQAGSAREVHRLAWTPNQTHPGDIKVEESTIPNYGANKPTRRKQRENKKK